MALSTLERLVTPAPAAAGGSSVLASASVNHAVQQTLGTGTTTINAALSVTFTVPASGSVIVMLQAAGYGNPGDSALFWHLLESGVLVPDSAKCVTAIGVANTLPYSVLIPIVGLTPDDAHTWVWGHGGSYPGGGYASTYGGIYGAAVMLVLAA